MLWDWTIAGGMEKKEQIQEIFEGVLTGIHQLWKRQEKLDF